MPDAREDLANLRMFLSNAEQALESGDEYARTSAQRAIQRVYAKMVELKRMDEYGPPAAYEIALYFQGVEVTAPGYRRTGVGLRAKPLPEYGFASNGFSVGPFEGPGFWADTWAIVGADGLTWGGADLPRGNPATWFGAGMMVKFPAGPLLSLGD